MRRCWTCSARFAGRPTQVLAEELGPAAPELARLLPELILRVPGVVPLPGLDPEQDKRRLFQALGDFLIDGIGQPVLIVIEDIHWSDATSVEFLLHLARRLRTRAVVLLLSYRTDEPTPVLRQFVAELERRRLATEVMLGPLGRDEVEVMLQAILRLDRPIRPDLLDALLGLTDGNPFFIEEVLPLFIVQVGDGRSAVRAWGPGAPGELRVPRTVDDAVRRRVEQLTRPARATLVHAAVIGQRFGFALLHEVAGQDEPDLPEQLKELVASQLIVEESPDRFAFRHALTRAAIYTELLGRERRRLHRQVLEAMQRLYTDALEAHVHELAYHAQQAQAWVELRTYAWQAGERAWAMHAPRAAVEHFTQALQAAQALDAAPPPSLHHYRGLACAMLGEFEAACADHGAALALASRESDQHAEWQAWLDLGQLWAGRDYTRAGMYFKRAEQVARQIDDAGALGQTLNGLGNWHLNSDEPAEARRYHEEALAIFRELGDRRGVAQTLDLLGLTCNMSEDLVGCVEHDRQATALFRDLDDPQALASCLAVQADCGEWYYHATAVPAALPAEDAIRHADEALRLARQIGSRTGEAYALIVLAGCLGSPGHYRRAFSCGHAGLAIAEDIEHREWMALANISLGALYHDVFAFSEAQAHLQRALALAHEAGSRFLYRCAAGLLASVRIACRDFRQADALLSAALLPDAPAEVTGARLCWLARAELARARHEPGRALEIIDRLAASAPHAAGGRVIPRLWQMRARAASALKRPAEAHRVLLEAADTATSHGAKSVVWRVDASLGRVYQALTRSADASAAFSAARAIADELAANIPDPQYAVNSAATRRG
jgi:predicted ATPase